MKDEAPPAEKAGTPDQEVVTTDVLAAAYHFTESMVARSDGKDGVYPLWHGWALREAFIAGANFARGAEPQPEATAGQTDEEICGDYSEYVEGGCRKLKGHSGNCGNDVAASRAARQEGKTKELGEKEA